MIIIVIDDKIKYLSVYALLVQLLRKQQKYYIYPQPTSYMSSTQR